MKKTLTVLCAALMFSAPLASFAQPGPPPGHGNGPSHQGNTPHGNGQHGKQPQGRPGNGHAPAPYQNPNFRPQPGMPIPHQQWQRGHAVDPHYRGDRYWVTDWRARHLYAPPRDHRWLAVNGDYVLVAIASGVIVNILSGY
ncbi:RcnB family protein [Pseudomonas sp. NGC7]|uniref:RcnB family protein n=1 Tax=Pseudomonas sp. NGC7 TaxID=3341775 RepID=UPI0037DB44E7